MNNDLIKERNQGHRSTSANAGVSPGNFVLSGAKTCSESPKQNSVRQLSKVTKRVILLVTDDTTFENVLQSAARVQGHIVMRVESLCDSLRVIRANCAHIAVVDLDMSAEIGWDMAFGLTRTPNCPPVALVTGRAKQFDIRMAVQTGAILSKESEPSRILKALGGILEGPPSILEERNEFQRNLIDWLSPAHWPVQSVSAWRHLGVNE